jgi:hypothetical protein
MQYAFKIWMESLKGTDHLETALPSTDMNLICSTTFFGQTKQSSTLWDLSLTSIPTMGQIKSPE